MIFKTAVLAEWCRYMPNCSGLRQVGGEAREARNVGYTFMKFAEKGKNGENE